MTTIDTHELDVKVQQMYRDVAERPHAPFHFETGRALAERLGYPADLLDAVPPAALDSFAGVGWFFDLAGLRPGEDVVDLGAGSGTDSFVAAHLVGPGGSVRGVDFTPEQHRKATRLVEEAGSAGTVEFWERRLEALPFPDACADCVVSNGVINLVADKARVFAEATRVLRPGGPVGDRGHRHRAAPRAGDHRRHRPLGLVHRGCRPDRRLPGAGRGGRSRGAHGPGERLRLPVRPGAGGLTDLRRPVGVDARGQARVTRGAGPQLRKPTAPTVLPPSST